MVARKKTQPFILGNFFFFLVVLGLELNSTFRGLGPQLLHGPFCARKKPEEILSS
jgi:hypothetical protein